MLFKTIRVSLNQRVVVFRHGLPLRLLGPGRHTIWGGDITTYTYDTNALIFDAVPEVRALIPVDWFDEVHLDARQRGVIYHDAVPVRFLRPGIHRYWTIDPAVELQVLSVDQPVPDLTDELIIMVPNDELVTVTVRQPERGLLYVQGRFERLLEPGRHAFWSHPEAEVVVKVIDMRMQQVTIQGQELMTRDKVTLRLTLTVEFAPADPPELAHSVADVNDALYLLVQLAARDYVAGVTLDELLEGRDAMRVTSYPRARSSVSTSTASVSRTWSYPVR